MLPLNQEFGATVRLGPEELHCITGDVYEVGIVKKS